VAAQSLFFKIETLSEQQQELIRKMSDDRLKQSLLNAGLPLAAINVLDRQALMSAWAEMVVSGRDTCDRCNHSIDIRP